MVPVPEKQGVPLQTMVPIIHRHERADINNRPYLAVIISRPDQIPRRRYTVASLVTRIRYRGNCPVTVHESMVTSVHKRMEPRRSLLGASVDVTEASKATS
jgi:hypothetical protein